MFKIRLRFLIRFFQCWVVVLVSQTVNGQPIDRLTGFDGKTHSPLGIGSCHSNNHSIDAYQHWIPKMQTIGLTSFRTPQTSWSELETQPGQWDWSQLDKQLNYLDEHGFNYHAMLIGYPAWHRKDGNWGLPVDHLDDWSNYVHQLATRLKGRTRMLEVWNEPPNFTAAGQTPADYAQVVVAASRAAKKVDPSMMIGLAAKSAHLIYLEQTIRAGAKDHFDYITLHPYEILDGIAGDKGSEAVFMNIVPSVRRMLRESNPERQNVPIVFTELGVDSKLGLAVQANTLVKAFVMSIAQGVACVHWFEGKDGDSGPLGLLDFDGQPRPAYFALGSLIKHLGPDPKYLGWVRPDGDHHGFVFQGNSEPVMIVWGAVGKPEKIRFDDPIKIIDPITGDARMSETVELGSAPMIIVAPPTKFLTEAKLNRDKPYLWDVDRSNAKEVSIEFGETTVNQGLHTLAGDRIAKAVVAYGGSARSGGIPGGNCFVVDPGFLSWDAVPIEVSVEVRRTPSRENAGFKFVYEGGDDFKTAGTWHTIPDNDQWNTITWRIDDPRFANYWGFNFRLESDGPLYSKYLLKKVTVKKIVE